jgi:hypothetical protein
MEKYGNLSDNNSVLLIDKLFFEAKFFLCDKHPYFFWFLVSLLPIGLSIILYLLENEAVFLRTEMPLSITFVLVPYGIKLGVNVFNDWGKDAFCIVP